jgi:L-alanine-DL-glutamate epimerase-like enolase superfamily enzyme
MDICVDCWGRFDFPSAMRIAKALEPYNIMYLEDAMLSGNAKTYARLAAETSVPVCISETLASRYEYREFFELKACDVIMYDVTWCGGPSEAKRISDMAEGAERRLLRTPAVARCCSPAPHTWLRRSLISSSWRATIGSTRTSIHTS